MRRTTKLLGIAALLLGVRWSAAVDDKPVAKPTGTRKIGASLVCDFDKKRVTLDAVVVLREGPLELFLCPKRTKEHESILAADVQPRNFQLALLLIGAQPGRPAQFEPYRAPTGQKLKVFVEYTDGGKDHRVDARTWIRDTKHNKPMEADFVFTGSGFQKIPGVERAVWMGDDGDLICVSNFPGSVVDIAAKSSKENALRVYEAWTDRIPARGTKVKVVFEVVD